MLRGCSTDFPVSVKDYGKIEWQNSIDVDVSGMTTNNFTLSMFLNSIMRMY